MKNKEIKSFTLSAQTIKALEAYSNFSNNSLSQSVEDLIHLGFENIEKTENIICLISER